MDFFWFDLFLEAREEILKKIIGILVETMTPKGHFEIILPLFSAWKHAEKNRHRQKHLQIFRRLRDSIKEFNWK